MTAVLNRALGYRNELLRNRIINGAMMISQENGAAAGTTTGYYPVDMFSANNGSGGTFSAAQVASLTPAGSPNRFRFTVTAADAAVAASDIAYLETRVEGFRAADLQFGLSTPKTVTISFGVKAPAGTYCLTILNSATTRSYVAEYVISAGEANTDVVKSVTIAGDQSGTWLKDAGVGFIIRWGLMAGTTFQQAANSWGTTNAVGSANQFNFMGTLSNVFELFDVGMYEGSAAPAFQVPDTVDELRRCERYFQLLDLAIIGGYAASIPSAVYHTLPHRTEMRAVPTITTAVAATVSNASVSAVGGTGSTGKSTRVDVGAIATGQFIVYAGTYRLNARL